MKHDDYFCHGAILVWFVERLWRSVKYERVYLKAYNSVSAARADIADCLNWFNNKRPHSRLEWLTPNEKYVASDARRRGKLGIVCNPPGFHLSFGECCSD